MQPDQISKPEVKATNGWRIFGILVSLFAIFLVCAAAGVGYWAYKLNNDLTASQQALDTLQGQYKSLQADNADLHGDIEQLTANLDQTKSDLEATRAELATAQSDLKQEQETTLSLRARMDQAAKLVDVAVAIWVDSQSLRGIDKTIAATGDDHLKELWDAYVEQNDSETFNAFEDYLYEAMAELLK